MECNTPCLEIYQIWLQLFKGWIMTADKSLSIEYIWPQPNELSSRKWFIQWSFECFPHLNHNGTYKGYSNRIDTKTFKVKDYLSWLWIFFKGFYLLLQIPSLLHKLVMNVMNLFPQLSVFKINRAELKLCIFWKIQLVHFDNLALSVLQFGYYE